ncbi:SOS response-associated peptidase family protein [Streptomyces sp. NPDC093509]|uniref:SOS response-associated peptidase family protein n=1 Tax=Streptomyces sp. NPDC093509 TaxID=3154982 RepID=UPI00344B5B66
MAVSRCAWWAVTAGRWVGNTRGEMAPLFQVPDVPAKETLAPNWNVAPTNDVWAVLERTPRDEEDSGNVRRELRPLRWGLVPSWAPDRGVHPLCRHAAHHRRDRSPAGARPGPRPGTR